MEVKGEEEEGDLAAAQPNSLNNFPAEDAMIIFCGTDPFSSSMSERLWKP